MSSFASSSENRSKGAAWTSKLYFDEDCENSKPGHFITAEELVRRLDQLVKNERILKVEMWKQPLSELQITKGVLYHAFIILETDEWWWSIEKNSEGLTMQRSKYRESVNNFYRGKKRTTGIRGINNMKKMGLPNAGVSLADFFNVLQSKHELAKEYSLFADNCQDFAQRLYQYFEEEESKGRFRGIIESVRRRLGQY